MQEPGERRRLEQRCVKRNRWSREGITIKCCFSRAVDESKGLGSTDNRLDRRRQEQGEITLG